LVKNQLEKGKYNLISFDLEVYLSECISTLNDLKKNSLGLKPLNSSLTMAVMFGGVSGALSRMMARHASPSYGFFFVAFKNKIKKLVAFYPD